MQLALIDLAAQAQQAAHLLQDFAEKLLHFVKYRDGIRKDTGYSQRLHLDGGVRAQPAWSELEIEWEMSAATLQGIEEQLTTVATMLERAKWWQREPNATYLNELQAMSSQLHELRLWLNAIVLEDSGHKIRDHCSVAGIE